MTDPIVWFALSLAGAITLCLLALAVWRAASSAPTIAHWSERASTSASALCRTFTRPGAAVLTGVTCLGLTVGIMWPLGWLARGLEEPLDVPVLEWAGRQQGTSWVELNEFITMMGNNRQIQFIILVTAVPLALLWRRRAWWVPTLLVPGTYLACRSGQAVLESVIGRNLPPTSSGDFPSGGVARTICVYGLILVLIAVAIGARRTTIAFLIGLAFTAGVVEAYTRVLLQKHWVTDAAAGVVFGILLLATGLTALWLLLRSWPSENSSQPTREEVAL